MAAKHALRHTGFTLVEVLVFVSILSGIFVTTLAIATQALRVSKTAEHRTLASHYADEVAEWILAESEKDWDTFLNTRAVGTSSSYCFNQQPVTAWPTTTTACTSYSLNTLYKRDVTLTKTSLGSGQFQVTATIVVTWTEGPNTYSVPLTILLNNT